MKTTLKIVTGVFLFLIVSSLCLYFFGVIDISDAIWENPKKYHIENNNPKETLIKYLKDRNISVKELNDKKIFLNFWEPGCGPCLIEIEHLNKIARTNKDSIVMLSFCQRDSVYVANYLKKRSIELAYPNVCNTVGLRTVMKKIAAVSGYKVDTIVDFVPFSIFLERDGTIIKVYSNALFSDSL